MLIERSSAGYPVLVSEGHRVFVGRGRLGVRSCGNEYDFLNRVIYEDAVGRRASMIWRRTRSRFVFVYSSGEVNGGKRAKG